MQIRRGTRTDQSGDEKRPERQAAITSQWGLRAGWESELWTLGHGPTMGPRWLWGTGMKQSNLSYDGYSISSKGFLPTVVDIMVI